MWKIIKALMIGQTGNNFSVRTVFHKSVRGASHIASEKPCQDYSTSYDECGITIAVVCDGHGGNTYFRSDVGAKIAAEITLDQLRGFAQSIPSEMFLNKEFSITAKPKHNPFIDSDGKRVRFEDLNETQQRYALQAKAYIKSEELCKEQQVCVEELLNNIYTEWCHQIRTDEKAHPFNKREKEVLHGLGVEKAYGCTLMAFLKTKDYWLSFHIGDGTILSCDEQLSWEKIVPEDCTCFLNYTTSLCDNNPLPEFRYAFNGTGSFPIAVMLCSDGVDGSLRTIENLQDFYEQIIGLFLDGDNIENELGSYFPTLSETGNKDDISIAGYIDLESMDLGSLRRIIELKRKTREVQNEYRSRKSEISSISEKIDNLKIKYDRLKDLRFDKQTELEELKQGVERKEQELADINKSVSSIKDEIENLRMILNEKNKELEDWKFTIKNEMAETEAELKNTNNTDEATSSFDYINW